MGFGWSGVFVLVLFENEILRDGFWGWVLGMVLRIKNDWELGS